MGRDYLDGGVFVDLSDSGTRIRRMSFGSLPPVVAIVDVCSGSYRLAKVAWNAAFEVGLAFSSPEYKLTTRELDNLLSADRLPKEQAPKSAVSRENRRWQRRRVRLRPVVLATLDRYFLGDSRMIDISEGGARLNCQNAKAMPESIMLFDVAENKARQANVVWRSETEIGVTYAGAELNETLAAVRRKEKPAGRSRIFAGR